MEHVRITVHTPIEDEGFANDLCDVLKLFFALDEYHVNPTDTEDCEAVFHNYEEKGLLAECSFSFRGQKHAAEESLPDPSGFVDRQTLMIAQKRVRKRLCKTTLYALLKSVTGIRPPWGSLTGIRPTRLVYERMEQGMDLESAVWQFQTVFDVSQEKTDLVRQIIIEQQKLPMPDVKEADVYIGIPFCRTRCAYCSFPGEALGKDSLVAPYMDALMYELERGAALLEKAGLGLRSLYIGGGTPSALNETDFARLMDETMRLYPHAREYTVEAGRPDTITRDKLETLRRVGVDRISINPQTMNDDTLRIIGRGHSARETVEAYELARKLGFENINMDVIAGLPGENTDSFRYTMQEIEKLQPDSLTVHTLALKRTSRLNIEKTPLPEGNIAAEMVTLGAETADRLGLVPYYLYRQKYMAGQQQNVGYARPGDACLYNVDIMEENTSILAMGAGGISKRVLPDRQKRIVRAPNVSNVSVYIDRVEEMAARKDRLFLSMELA